LDDPEEIKIEIENMSNQKKGWVKLHRKFRDNPIYRNSTAVHVWIECLLRAAHAEEEEYLSRQKVQLKPGQFCMGRKEFGASIGISGSTAYFWIHSLKADNILDITSTTKGTIVTILKWDEYQSLDTKVDNKKTTEKQQMNTYKNVKNVKNVKNKDIDVFISKFNSAFTKQYKPTGGRARALAIRLKSFTLDMVLQAVDNLSHSSFHTGLNDRGWTADPDFILRSDEQVDKWLQMPVVATKKYIQPNEETLKILNQK